MKVTIDIPKTAGLQAASLAGMDDETYEKLLDVVQESSDIDITSAVSDNEELASLPLLVACGVLMSLASKLEE